MQLTKGSPAELLELETKRFWALMRSSFYFETALNDFFLRASLANPQPLQ